MKKLIITLVGSALCVGIFFLFPNKKGGENQQTISSKVEQKPAPSKAPANGPLRFENLHLNPEMK